ncbi:MAG: YopX family protein [Methermicoccaceae archaeon]
MAEVRLMGKVIDFRVWDKEEKKMHYDLRPVMFGPFDDINDIFDDERYIFMQYIKRQDKNGQKIYQGDILVADDGFTYVVQIEEIEGKYSVVGYDHAGRGLAPHLWSWSHTTFLSLCEVTGNIYENPELLEGICP